MIRRLWRIGEVYYRYIKRLWMSSGNGAQSDGSNRVMLNTTLFTTPTLYHQNTGYVTTAGTSCAESLYDTGTSDSSLSGTIVAESTLAINSTSKTLQRSPALTFTSGDRVITYMNANTGPGVCLSVLGLSVVTFGQ
jgi:hypothetical protein